MRSVHLCMACSACARSDPRLCPASPGTLGTIRLPERCRSGIGQCEQMRMNRVATSVKLAFEGISGAVDLRPKTPWMRPWCPTSPGSRALFASVPGSSETFRDMISLSGLRSNDPSLNMQANEIDHVTHLREAPDEKNAESPNEDARWRTNQSTECPRAQPHTAMASSDAAASYDQLVVDSVTSQDNVRPPKDDVGPLRARSFCKQPLKMHRNRCSIYDGPQTRAIPDRLGGSKPAIGAPKSHPHSKPYPKHQPTP